MSVLNKSIYAYNPDEMIDLDGVLDEESSQLFNFSSIDDNQLNELTRGLVTPTPNNKTTIDLVKSDIKDYIAHFDMDDLISKAPTRIENSNARLNILRRVPSAIQRRPLPTLQKQDKKNQILTALEAMYQKDQQNKNLYLVQLKEIDIKAYETIKNNGERMIRKMCELIEQTKRGDGLPEKTKSSENSTTTSASSQSNDMYYDPPEVHQKKSKKTDDVYPQDSISSSNEPLLPDSKKKKEYQAQLNLIRSLSTEEKKKREDPKLDYLGRPIQPEKPLNNYLFRARKSTDESSELKRRSMLEDTKQRQFRRSMLDESRLSKHRHSIDPLAFEQNRVTIDSYLSRPRKSTEESYLRKPAEKSPSALRPKNTYSSIPRKSFDRSPTLDNGSWSKHRSSIEESKAKVDMILNRPRRNTDESRKHTGPLVSKKKSFEDTISYREGYENPKNPSKGLQEIKPDYSEQRLSRMNSSTFLKKYRNTEEKKSDRDVALSYLNRGQHRNEQPRPYHESRSSAYPLTRDHITETRSSTFPIAREGPTNQRNRNSTLYQRNNQDLKKNDGEKVTDSAKRLLAMIHEGRLKRHNMKNTL